MPRRASHGQTTARIGAKIRMKAPFSEANSGAGTTQPNIVRVASRSVKSITEMSSCM